MGKEIKSGKHVLCEKAPLLALLLGVMIPGIAMTVPGLLGLSPIIENLTSSLIALIILIIFDRKFRPEFKGVFKAFIPFREMLIVLAPFIFMFFGSFFADLTDHEFYFNPTLLALVMGIAAGFYEETFIRGITIPLGMRYLKSKNRMYIIAIATSLVFGLIHLGNTTQGANPAIALIQCVATVFGGLLFAALYLRTGSVLVPIFAHGIFDYMCFVTDPSLDDGIMTAQTVTTGLKLALAVHAIAGLWALYLIRPAVKDKIEALWNEKWSV